MLSTVHFHWSLILCPGEEQWKKNWWGMASCSKQQDNRQKTTSSEEPLWRPHVPPGTQGPEVEEMINFVLTCLMGF